MCCLRCIAPPCGRTSKRPGGSGTTRGRRITSSRGSGSAARWCVIEVNRAIAGMVSWEEMPDEIFGQRSSMSPERPTSNDSIDADQFVVVGLEFLADSCLELGRPIAEPLARGGGG